VLLICLAATGVSRGGEPLRNVTVSWLGNSFPGADKWVQQDIHALAVTPDGTVYTNVEWDEAGRNVGVYKDGDVVGNALHTHGWGYEGGRAVAINSSYLFIGQTVNNEGGGLQDPNTWPPKGKNWIGVSRRSRASITRAAPFPGAKGGKGDTLKGGFLVVAEIPERSRDQITGLAANEHRLFVSDQAAAAIRVFDAETLTALDRWPLERPGPLALDRNGALWVLQEAGAGKPARVVCYSPAGKSLPRTIELPSEVVPTALGIDAAGSRLFVADDGPGQQIRIYSQLDTTPSLVKLFGAPGGILSGTPGRFDRLKFNHPSAVGADAEGNLYIDKIKRLRYDPTTDTMYLGGTTEEHGNRHWKPMGPVIARYDHWTTPDPKPRWTIVSPYARGSRGHESCEPMGFDIAGDYLFVPYTGASREQKFATGHIEVFRLADGAGVGSMEPSREIGEVGLQDIRECLRAHRRNDGSYVVFLEDDAKSKVLMYRWTP
jgi:hypothetical protein